MFNFKIFSKVKLAQTTPEELVSQNIPATTQLPFTTDVATDVENLRKLAGELIKAEGSEVVSADVIDKVMKKLLNRAADVHIPVLQKLMGMSMRSEKVVPQLLEYQTPEQVATIRNFISTEVFKLRFELYNDFMKILQYAKRFNPDFTLEMLCFMLQNRPETIAKNEEIVAVISGEQAGEIKKQLNDLAQKTRNMNLNTRPWNRILNLHRDIMDREKWAALIPDELRIEWDLVSVLKFFPNVPLSYVPEKIRTQERKYTPGENIKYFFEPEKDELGRDLVTEIDKRNYKLKKLKECVENFEPEQLFEILQIKVKKGRIQRGRPKKDVSVTSPVSTAPEEETEEIEVEETSRVRTDDPLAKKIKFYFDYLVVMGEAGSIMDPSSRLGAFRRDLREAGLPLYATVLEKAYVKPEDERYAEFDLKFLSQEEKNICEILREDFNLDPIPFPVKIPCPIDNPTTSERFEIDFLLPADVFVGLKIRKRTVLDQNTGELKEIRVFEPQIENQVIFVGEYFGIRFSMPGRKISDNPDKPWVRPDGSLPVYEVPKYVPVIDKATGEQAIDEVTKKRKTEKIVRKFTVVPGGNFEEQQFYNLKTEWKEFTTTVIGDLLGTGTLSLDINDLNTPWKNIVPKLDRLNIIYQSKYCTDDYGCWALKQIRKYAERNPDLDIYLDESIVKQRFDDVRLRSIKLIDCAIVNIKLTEALTKAKTEFVTDPFENNFGFQRAWMHQHKTKFDELRNNLFTFKRLGYLSDPESLAERSEIEEEIRTLKNSPLKNFKEYLDKILSEGVISEKIRRLEALKDEVMSSETPMSFIDLRRRVNEELQGSLEKALEERGKGQE